MHSRRQTANAKPLSLAERKSRVVAVTKGAPAKVRAGIERIDFRELTAREIEYAETLGPLARRALARRGRQAA